MPITDAALGTSDRLGRNFSIVGMLPSLLFVMYVAALLAAGAAAGPFAPSRAVDAVSRLGVVDGALLVVVSLALSIALHPFQFGFTQFLEGYWGGRRAFLGLAARRISAHRSQREALKESQQRARAALLGRALPGEDTDSLTSEEIAAAINTYLDSTYGAEGLRPYLAFQAAGSSLLQYPTRPRRMMPTRLGNVLRSFEDSVGSQYGLNAILIAQHLKFASIPEHDAYVADTRQQLDVAVRVCGMALLATPTTAALLADEGCWVLLVVFPYSIAYLAYRGAISAAHAYASAFSSVLDSNRFRLYDLLHLEAPRTTRQECDQNRAAMRQLAGEGVNLHYSHVSDSNS